MTNKTGIHVIVQPAFNIMHWFGVMPLEGINWPDSSKLKFSWSSKQVYLLFLVMLGYSMIAIHIVLNLPLEVMTHQFSLFNMGVSPLIELLLFLHLAWRWPLILNKWEFLESTNHLQTLPKNFDLHIKIFTYAVVCCSLGGKVVSHIKWMTFSYNCKDYTSMFDKIKAAHVFKLKDLIQNTTSHVPLLLLIFAYYYSQMLKVFLDLILGILFLTIAEHFKQFSNKLQSVKYKNTPQSFWQEMKANYHLLAQLTKEMDSYLNGMLMFSLSFNIISFLITINSNNFALDAPVRTVCQLFKALVIILRTLIVIVSAAQINYASKGPLEVLFSVPSESYCSVVESFEIQVASQEVALTGYRTFSITYHLLFKIFSIIITYQSIIIQNGEDNMVDRSEEHICQQISLIMNQLNK